MQEGVEVVAVGAPEVSDAAQHVPREAAVELGLVADLETLDPLDAERAEERSRLGGGEVRIVGLEVDPDDRLSVEGRGERVGDAEPAGRDVIPDTGRPLEASVRVPRPVGRVATDSQLRGLAGREVAQQLHEHRVDRSRIRASVRFERPELD